VAFVQNNYINPPVKSAAFLGLIGRKRRCIGKTGYLKPAFINAKGG
jgi:hypothetical protein